MKNFTNAFVTALTARNEAAPSKDIQLAINNATRFTKALDGLFTKKAFHAISEKLIKRVSIAEKKTAPNDFIAVKVLVKIVGASVAIAQKNTSTLDPYSETIITNLIALSQITNKDTLVSLSKSIEYDEFEQQANLKARYNCSAGTASTQASSTRMMLDALDICNVEKAKKGDTISFKDNERSRNLIALFIENIKESHDSDELQALAELDDE